MFYEKARKYIYRNARPLDIARWKYLFEGGSSKEVLISLMEYQNDDGGFGSALEIDCWNPNSSPIQTWVATEIIKEIKLEDKNHPIIKGILDYLASGKEFNGQTWLNSIESNNDYPHAPWWDYDSHAEVSYNPTAALIGFILKFADKGSKVYELARNISKEAYRYFKQQYPMESMHTVSCFVELYEYIKESSEYDLIDLDEFKTLLQKQINHVLTDDTSKWSVEYVCKPSLFISSNASDFYSDNKELCIYECDFISNTQKEDGTWEITWNWAGYEEQWSISKNWWKCDLIIKNTGYFNKINKERVTREKK